MIALKDMCDPSCPALPFSRWEAEEVVWTALSKALGWAGNQGYSPHFLSGVFLWGLEGRLKVILEEACNPQPGFSCCLPTLLCPGYTVDFRDTASKHFLRRYIILSSSLTLHLCVEKDHFLIFFYFCLYTILDKY